eukprot:s3589_g4.t1
MHSLCQSIDWERSEQEDGHLKSISSSRDETTCYFQRCSQIIFRLLPASPRISFRGDPNALCLRRYSCMAPKFSYSAMEWCRLLAWTRRLPSMVVLPQCCRQLWTAVARSMAFMSIVSMSGSKGTWREL